MSDQGEVHKEEPQKEVPKVEEQPRKVSLFNLPPPPPKPEPKVESKPEPKDVNQEMPTTQNASFSGSSSSLLSTSGQTKIAFNFPKFPIKRTRAASEVEKPTLLKSVPSIKRERKVESVIQEKEEDSGSESEEEADGVDTGSLNSSNQISLLIHIPFLKKTETIKFSPYCTISETMKIIMEECSIDQENYQVSDFKVCKMGRSGMASGDNRVWLEPSLSLNSYRLKSGDELKIKYLKEKYTVQVNKPPSSTIYSFVYDFNTTVKVALISLLKDATNSSVGPNEKFGLYYPMKGIWLDESKTLEYYDIDPQHSLDLRQLSQEILLKVNLPDSANKIGMTLKVVLSQTVGEVINMIHKKVNVENSYQCSLFYPAKQLWLDNGKTLEEYEVESNAILEYKGKFRLLKIYLSYDNEALNTKEKSINILVDEKATAEDLIHLIEMNNPTLEEDSHSIFYQSGQIIKPTTLIQELHAKDAVEYRVTPRTIKMTPSYDPSTIQSFQIDFTLPFKLYLPSISRRFGIKQNLITLINQNDNTKLDVNKSLYQQRINSETLFAVQQNETPNTNEDEGIMWKEEIENENEKTILFETQGTNSKQSDKVLAGTLNKLVERLTDDKSHDLTFVKTFLMTYRSFTTPEILLQKMIERYHVPRPSNVVFEDFERNYKRPIQLRVFNVLKQWIEKHSSDFLEGTTVSPLADQVSRFIREILSVDDPKLAKQLLNTMEKLRDGTLSGGMKEFSQDVDPPMIKYPTKENPRIFDYHAEEIARQLTYIEFEIFQDIKPSELLNQNWNRSQANVLSPNVLRISERFNRNVLWVVSSIIQKTQIRQRVARMEKLISIASYLHSLNNFSTLMAFVAGFNNAAVQRLKFTRAELSNKALRRLEMLETLMSAEGSYKHYRSVIHTANPPLIPYIGVYLADLTFIDDGNPNLIEGLINFSKRRLDYNVISEIQLYQNKPFNLGEFPELKSKLLEFPEPSEVAEKELYETSLKLEPRGAERS